MSSNSEARKRQERADAVRLSHVERRREVAQQALEALYTGAGMSEADALLDQLADRGFTISEVRL